MEIKDLYGLTAITMAQRLASGHPDAATDSLLGLAVLKMLSVGNVRDAVLIADSDAVPDSPMRLVVRQLCDCAERPTSLPLVRSVCRAAHREERTLVESSSTMRPCRTPELQLGAGSILIRVDPSQFPRSTGGYWGLLRALLGHLGPLQGL